MSTVVEWEDEPEFVPVLLTAAEFLEPPPRPTIRGRPVILGESLHESQQDHDDYWMRPEEREAKVVECIRAAGGPVSARVISKRLVMRRQTIAEVLKRLARRGEVRRVKAWEARWELTSPS